MLSRTMRLTGLFIYPVKGCRGIPLSRSEVDVLGLEGDRRFMVIDPAGNFLTQRSDPRLTTIDTQLTPDTLKLSAPACSPIDVPRSEDRAPLIRVKIWSSANLAAEDCGENAASWLSAVLNRPARLVRVGSAFRRPVLKSTALPGDLISFPDAAPFLIISEGSLADLNRRLDVPVPMDRFRPNLVVSDCAAFEEDTWPRLKIGAVSFRAAGPCVRCTVITNDQLTGERGKEPLRTLGLYRRDPYNDTNVHFGQNLLHDTMTGTINVGDSIEVLSSKTGVSDRIQ